MNRRTQLNLLLVASALVLSILLWGSQSEQQNPKQPLLSIDRQAIDRIEIHPGGNSPVIVLTRKGQDWHLTQPVDARARDNRIESLLAMAGVMPIRRYEADEFAAESAGLTPPRATIRFSNAPVMAVGARTPINGRTNTRYLRAGDTVAIAALPNAGLLDLGWPQWVDPSILAEGAQLKALHLPGLTLTRTDNGGWATRPENLDLGADAAQFTVDAWRHARAMRITAAGDRPAKAAIKLVFADGRTRRLEIVTYEPQLLLRDPVLGITYHLPADKAGSLLARRYMAPEADTTTR